jgi:hypothetical protein
MSVIARYTWIALAAALLVTRVGLAAHEVDLKNHKAGENCEFCVHAGALKHSAAAPAPVAFAADLQVAVFLPFAPSFAPAPVIGVRARGPPVAVSIV